MAEIELGTADGSDEIKVYDEVQDYLYHGSHTNQRHLTVYIVQTCSNSQACSNFQLEAVRTWQLGQLEHTCQKHLAGAFDLYGCHGTSIDNRDLSMVQAS